MQGIKVSAKRITSIVMAVVLCCVLECSMATPLAHAAYPSEADCDMSWYSDEGTTFDLSTPEQLAGLAYLVNVEHKTFLGKTVRLADNIDLSEICSNGVNWRPIGTDYTSGESFQGVFDGQNYKVSNLLIDDSGYYNALFGSVKHATVKNLVVSGEVRGTEYVGGIISMCSDSDLCNLVNECTVDAYTYNAGTSHEGRAAGVVCYIATVNGTANHEFKNLVNRGSIKSTSYYTAGVIGFLLDLSSKTTVFQCANYGSVEVAKARYGLDGEGKGVGGVLGATALAGYGTYEVSECVNAGSVSSNNCPMVGGVAGFLGGTSSSIEYSENSGDVSGAGNAGGIAGYLGSSGGRIGHSLNLGSVSGDDAGGILGSASRSEQEFVLNYTYDEACSTAYGENSGGLNDDATKTADEMKRQKFLDLLNDGLDVYSIVSDDNRGLPILTWTNPSAMPGLGGIEDESADDSQQGASGDGEGEGTSGGGAASGDGGGSGDEGVGDNDSGDNDSGDDSGSGDESTDQGDESASSANSESVDGAQGAQDETSEGNQTDESAQEEGESVDDSTSPELPKQVSPEEVGAEDPTASQSVETKFTTIGDSWEQAGQEAESTEEASKTDEAAAESSQSEADAERADREKEANSAEGSQEAEQEDPQKDRQDDSVSSNQAASESVEDDPPAMQLVEVAMPEDGTANASRGAGTPMETQILLSVVAIACLAAGAIRENAVFGRSCKRPPKTA